MHLAGWWWLLGLVMLPVLLVIGLVLAALKLAVALVLAVVLSPLGLLALVAYLAYRAGESRGARARGVTPTR